MKETALLGNEQPGKEELATMRERGGSWAAYQNHDMGSKWLGMLRFMKYGEGCTFAQAPQRLPDTRTEINWRYVLVGFVDEVTGLIVPKRKEEHERIG